MAMTADAKRALSSTIRDLRERLLEDLHNATESAYRLSIHKATDAGLDEAARKKRERLKDWMSEQARAQDSGKAKGKEQRTAEDFRREAEAQAAYTLLNRLVFLRLLETPGPDGKPLRSPAVVTGGADSRGYQDFRELAPALVRDDASEGYAFLLQLVFEELAVELPGLFGPVGVSDLIPIPAATLRHVVEALNDPALDACFTDDMTLGWVYQYWNDPERERLDAKLNDGGKVEPHEIASKTQMFTERYMVDWLLQNSLGPMWLAMCRKHGWTPEVEAVESDGESTLSRLEKRRVEWREKREAGEVSLTALMPLHTDAERRWAYYVPQPIPDDAVAQAPESVRDLKILDPAVGSGHFLVVAMDLLFALYREEARHRGEAGDERWSDRAIVERILSHNLHGIDLDPRAVQIAAAALWLKAKKLCPEAMPERLNLVASNLRLASLPNNDPALVELRREVERETGIPAELTDTIVNALSGADHLGSLLKIDRAVDEALDKHEKALAAQGELFSGITRKRRRQRITPSRDEARQTLLDRLEVFLDHHTRGDDLGLRLRGEQLATGVRFARMVREGTYDLVVANPPYQGTSKMADATYVAKHYKLGKADLYAAFLLRGLELVRQGGIASQVSMNGWMFIKQYSGLRQEVLGKHSLRSIVDLLWCAFEQMRHNTVAMYCIQRGQARDALSVGLVPTPRDEREESIPALKRKRAATLCQIGRHEFDPAALKVVPEWPLVYWWDTAFREQYAKHPKLVEIAPAKQGLATADNVRFLRCWWEPSASLPVGATWPCGNIAREWQFFIKGGEGARWFEPCRWIIRWKAGGLELKNFELNGKLRAVIRNESLYFKKGIAFTMLGADFSARAHRAPSVFDTMGSSVFPDNIPDVLCCLNSERSLLVMGSLNPTIHFQQGDVDRIPVIKIPGSDRIFDTLEISFTEHEAHREPSVEFKGPGPSPWRHAQEWAQAAVDRPEGAPLPTYEAEYDPEPATDHVSFALGVALGRFGKDGEGILDPAKVDLSHGLPEGILFLDGTLEPGDDRDGLGHPAAAPLVEAWKTYGADITDKRKSLRDYLALDFFKEVHKGMYENRPIHWPLSSEKKTFVAWVTIHRMSERTLRILLADHLHPTLRRLDGELADLRSARDSGDARVARDAETEYTHVVRAKEELENFIANVEQCADRGAPPTDAKCTPREQDARYPPDLDDGVMINSAALWPLLEPQWSDPKKWWKTLSAGQGKKHYDWAHLAMRYWPTRVDKRCQEDPSLAVAHGCFWRYHPERAWAWELRLQDEIGPDFRIEEAPYRPGGRDLGDPGSAAHRQTYLRESPQEALAAVEKEATRRRKALTKSRAKGDKAQAIVETMTILEPGLWSTIPDQVWATELRLAQKQGADFRLLAPDEPAARQAYQSAHPKKVAERQNLFGKTLFDPKPARKHLVDS